MILCTVIGNVVSQQKEDSLVGKKMLLCETQGSKQERIVAVDLVGSGVGSEVLVSRRYGSTQGYIDHYIVGIVDMISEG